MHIFIGFVVFYWILAPILYYTNVSSFLFFFPINLIFYQVLGSRLLPHLLKRTLRPFWQNLQCHSCTPSKRHIQRNRLQPLFPALPLNYVCYDLSPVIRFEHMCTCAYGFISWKKFGQWAEDESRK